MTLKEALISRQTIRRLSKQYTVQAIEKIQFDPSLKNDYRDLFDEFVEKGRVRARFEDSCWIFIQDKTGSTVTFLFNMDMFKGFNLALKCYALQKIASDVHMVSTQTYVNYLKEAILKSQGFRLEKLDLLEEYIVSLGYRKRSKMGYAIIEFLKFYQVAAADEFIGLASQFSTSKRRARDLPAFHGVLMFDFILTKYFSVCTEEEKLKYSIIHLWWRLTKVIPMRPVEFYNLSKDCIQYLDGTYGLTIPRAKQSPKHNEQLEVTNTLQINQELYNIIVNYKEQTEPYLNRGNPDLLLSYDIYKLFFSKNETKARKIDSVRFHRILENFYKNVLEKRYGYHASDRLTAGDTRHYAFCNMMLQGFNMLSIARIGGHKMLRMQMHYHAHLEHFAESAVYILSQNHIKKSKHFSNTSLNKEVEIRSKVLDKKDFTHLYEVEHGYCTDHPSRCKVGDCRFCEFYFFSPDNKEHGLRWLRDCSQTLKSRMKEQIQLMIAISKNMDYSLKTLEFPLHKQELLSTSANELRRLMDQKAMVDAELTGGGKS